MLAFPPWKWRLSIQQSLVGPGHLTGRPHPRAPHCPTLFSHTAVLPDIASGCTDTLAIKQRWRVQAGQGLFACRVCCAHSCFSLHFRLQKARCRQQLRLSLLKHLGRSRAYLTKTSQGSNQLTSQRRLLSECYGRQESRFKISFVRAWNYLEIYLLLPTYKSEIIKVWQLLKENLCL